MAIKLGSILPTAGKPLEEAALMLAREAPQQCYDQPPKELVQIGMAETNLAVDRIPKLFAVLRTAALRWKVQKMLRSGELQAIATELGVDLKYYEVPTPHWTVLSEIDWRNSTARRPIENSPLFYILVFPREVYDQLLGRDNGEKPSPTRKVLRKNLKARILEEFKATPHHIKVQWQTKAEAARWIRDHIDGKGEDRDMRRHVLQVLEAELASLFPNAPDGVLEK